MIRVTPLALLGAVVLGGCGLAHTRTKTVTQARTTVTQTRTMTTKAQASTTTTTTGTTTSGALDCSLSVTAAVRAQCEAYNSASASNPYCGGTLGKCEYPSSGSCAAGYQEYYGACTSTATTPTVSDADNPNYNGPAPVCYDYAGGVLLKYPDGSEKIIPPPQGCTG